MVYKGYIAESRYSTENSCLVAELQAAFEEAVEDYLEMREESGRPPQKPYSGELWQGIS